MRLTCGTCGKLYAVLNTHFQNKALTFRCSNCGNTFTFTQDKFKSSSKNSTVLCKSCGRFIEENHDQCEHCGQAMGVDTKRLPIDNREYELLEVRENGKLYNKETGKLLTRNKVKVAILLVLCCLVAFGIYFYFNSTKGKEQVQSVLHKTLHTKKAYVIILRNGDAFVAAHYEEKGSSLFFVDKDNQMHEVPQTDIMQIREAVMED